MNPIKTSVKPIRNSLLNGTVKYVTIMVVEFCVNYDAQYSKVTNEGLLQLFETRTGIEELSLSGCSNISYPFALSLGTKYLPNLRCIFVPAGIAYLFLFHEKGLTLLYLNILNRNKIYLFWWSEVDNNFRSAQQLAA